MLLDEKYIHVTILNTSFEVLVTVTNPSFYDHKIERNFLTFCISTFIHKHLICFKHNLLYVEKTKFMHYIEELLSTSIKWQATAVVVVVANSNSNRSR